MQPFPQGHARNLRVASILLALLVLLAVVALASGSGFGHASKATPTPSYVNWATSVIVVVFFALIPVAIWAQVNQTRDRIGQGKRRSFQARVLRGLALVSILALIWPIRTYLAHHVHLFKGIHDLFFGNHRASGHRKHGAGAATTSPTFQWPVLWAAVVLVVAGAGGWLWWRRTHPALPLRASTPTMESDLATSLGDAIDDLESEPDARRAVIAAYARMEGVFGRHGLRRHASETATEYLQRILLGLTTRVEAVGRLTHLFEQAKFSDHPIDGRMKQDAIDALRVIRNDLRGAEA